MLSELPIDTSGFCDCMNVKTERLFCLPVSNIPRFVGNEIIKSKNFNAVSYKTLVLFSPEIKQTLKGI